MTSPTGARCLRTSIELLLLAAGISWSAANTAVITLAMPPSILPQPAGVSSVRASFGMRICSHVPDFSGVKA